MRRDVVKVQLKIEDEVFEAKVRQRTRREIVARKDDRKSYVRERREEREYAY